MSNLNVKDRLRIEWAVLRVDYELDARVPRARRRQIRSELRANLVDAASIVGAEKAVQQLGNLHDLAKSYLDVYRGRWDFRTGALAAIAVYAIVQILALAIFIGFSTGVLAGGGRDATYAFWNGFGPFAGSASGHGFTMLIGSPAHLILMGIAFVLGSAHRQILRR